jgi:hypothetical protein
VTLEALGLRPGEKVRFRRPDRARWQTGTVRRLERDGSLGLVDGNGASRAVALELVEVRVAGPRGATAWEPLPVRAGRVEQLDLLSGVDSDHDGEGDGDSDGRRGSRRTRGPGRVQRR